MRRRDLVLLVYLGTCAFMLVWPGYALIGNRVKPLVLGLPFALFWNAAWAVATFLALLVYDRGAPCEGREGPEGRREQEE